MKGFLAKTLCAGLILGGLASHVLAQNSNTSARGASFLPLDADTSAPSTPVFSGLAIEMPEPPPPEPTASASDLAIEPVTVAALPNVSPESIGEQKADGLGAEMWKGTNRNVAERLLSSLSPSGSSVLNDLVMRLLMTAAVPPEGNAESPQYLTSKRVEKLILFGDIKDSWSLAKQVNSKLIDVATYHRAAETALVNGEENLCAKATDLAKTHPGVDWQQFNIICYLRAKDTKAAQVALDVFRSEGIRDNVFVDVADRNIFGQGRSLPVQLTPLTTPTLALLQIVNLPLPGNLFNRADYSDVAALLRLPVQQDVARLALAERAAERGLIDIAELEAIYRVTSFSPDTLASPLTASESGLRLRALLFRASEGQTDANRRIALALRFVDSAPSALLNGAGTLVAAILGDIRADPGTIKDAATVAYIYMLAGKTDAARGWYNVAKSSDICAESIQRLWPQLALGGLEADNAYAAAFDKWFAGALKTTDEQKMNRVIEPTLLFLNAAGKKIPDNAWTKVFLAPPVEKKISFSPVLFERMRIAAAARKRAETVLLATALAGEGKISLPIALSITSALAQTGFKNESSNFARQAIALLAEEN